MVLPLLLTSGDRCYFVSNTRIRLLPSCDIDPSTIDELTEDPSPTSAAAAQLRWAPGARWSRPTPRPSIVVRGNEELERRLEVVEQEKIDAVAQRVTAEAQRDIAMRQRDEAKRDLAIARKELATLRERRTQAAHPGHLGPKGSDLDAARDPTVGADQTSRTPGSPSGGSAQRDSDGPRS
jgi:hypothetical protein